jgi:hypothetical protein
MILRVWKIVVTLLAGLAMFYWPKNLLELIKILDALQLETLERKLNKVKIKEKSISFKRMLKMKLKILILLWYSKISKI